MQLRNRRQKQWDEVKYRATIFGITLLVLLWMLCLFLGSTTLVRTTWDVLWVSVGCCVLIAAITAARAA